MWIVQFNILHCFIKFAAISSQGPWGEPFEHEIMGISCFLDSLLLRKCSGVFGHKIPGLRIRMSILKKKRSDTDPASTSRFTISLKWFFLAVFIVQRSQGRIRFSRRSDPQRYEILRLKHKQTRLINKFGDRTLDYIWKRERGDIIYALYGVFKN